MENTNYPEEYTIGNVTFFGKKFMITPEVLIPRLETECLVRRARKLIQSQDVQTLVDIGTGSGIIWVSCADMVDSLVFLDISEKALSVARSNFLSHFSTKEALFLESDLLSSLPSWIVSPESWILFLANLPYIKSEDWKNMSADTHFEPEIALFGGEETGFEMYERLFGQLSQKKIQGILMIEFWFDQRFIAEEKIKKYGWKYDFFPDHAGIERFCEIAL
jgi:release factor glutamine methyltransferase